MFFTATALKYALLVSQCDRYGHFLKLTDSVYLNNTINFRHLTQRIISCYTHKGWWRGTVVERRSLAGELSLSCV